MEVEIIQEVCNYLPAEVSCPENGCRWNDAPIQILSSFHCRKDRGKSRRAWGSWTSLGV